MFGFVQEDKFYIENTTMKFSVKTLANNSIRAGVISDIARLPGVEIQTPLLLLYTKGGSLPHISREVLQLLTEDQIGIHIPLPSTLQCYEGVKGFSKGISTFAGLKESITFCSIQDPAAKTPVGFNTKENISIWSYNGRHILDSTKYMKIMEAFQPDFYEALYNGDTNEETSSKKLTKVALASQKFLDSCLEKHKNSSILCQSGIFAIIEGGYDLELRKKCAKDVADKTVNGFVVGGLHNNGSDVENLNFDKVKPVLKTVLENLPDDKPRLVHGCWKPATILKMIDLGVDIFDSSFPYIVTQRHSALVFRYTESKCNVETVEDSSKQPLEICLEDKTYKEDFGPILEGCSCLTCSKYKRAYVHHLIHNKELLAATLLMILPDDEGNLESRLAKNYKIYKSHNFHHYMEFFKSIRKAAVSGKKICLS